MNKKTMTLAAAALAAVFAAQPQAARADGPLDFLFRGNPKVVATGIVVGAGSIGAYYAIAPRHHHHTRFGLTKAGAMGLTTVGCMAVSPIVAAAWVGSTEHRELTQHEALGLVGNCVVPVLGGLFWDWAYAAHPEWEHPPIRAKY
jgi:hypothetical protein